jgi:hypothetical protein
MPGWVKLRRLAYAGLLTAICGCGAAPATRDTATRLPPLPVESTAGRATRGVLTRAGDDIHALSTTSLAAVDGGCLLPAYTDSLAWAIYRFDNVRLERAAQLRVELDTAGTQPFVGWADYATNRWQLAPSDVALELPPAACSPLGHCYVLVVAWDAPVTVRALSLTTTPPERLDKLAAEYLEPYLAERLWTARDMYDAGSVLQVPLHTAFALGRSDWIALFEDQFTRFVAQFPDDPAAAPAHLHRLHYYYVASRFCALCAASDQPERIPKGLPELLREQAHWYWTTWTKAGGYRQAILWRLSKEAEDIEPSDARLIGDDALLLLGVAADLRQLDRYAGREPDPLLVEMGDVTRQVFENRAVWNGSGGWLFQQGVYRDHRDYSHVGWDEVTHGLPEWRLAEAAADSSHECRLALLLRSYAEGAGPDSADASFYADLRRGLEDQFCDVVVVAPDAQYPYVRLRNFMDGRNGLFRYGYPTLGDGLAYGPYELSGTFTYGWWAFLESPRVSDLYRYAAAHLPLPQEGYATYLGPGSSRARHPLLNTEEWYRGEFMEFMLLCASELPATP